MAGIEDNADSVQPSVDASWQRSYRGIFAASAWLGGPDIFMFQDRLPRELALTGITTAEQPASAFIIDKSGA
jgi:hypothetical protein